MYYPDCYKNEKLTDLIKQEIDFNPVSYRDVKLSIKQSFAQRLLKFSNITEEILSEIAEKPHLLMHPLGEYMRSGDKDYCFDISEALAAITYKVCDPIIEDIYNDLYEDYRAHMNEYRYEDHEGPFISLTAPDTNNIFKIYVNER